MTDFDPTQAPDALKAALAHVRRIGGSTDAGKTTAAAAIAERHGLHYYSFDRHERSQIERLVAAGTYSGRRNPYEMTPDELWIDQEPEEMARDVMRSWSRRAMVAVDDLLALPQSPPIVAEGPGFFPEVIQPLLSSSRQAIWFVPEPQFKRKIARQRRGPIDPHQG
jgi:hypothetical protein